MKRSTLFNFVELCALKALQLYKKFENLLGLEWEVNKSKAPKSP